MKVIKIVTHPFTLILSFFIILINGEGFGGFFLLYLLLGLPYGAIHSLLSFAGVVAIMINYSLLKGRKDSTMSCLVEIGGILLLILALFLFFYNDKEHYNFGTFYRTVPVITLILFVLISFSTITTNILTIFKILSGKRAGFRNS